MKRIILYGDLAKKFGKEHCFEVKTVAEAVRALRANFKDFEKYLCDAHKYGVGFKVWAGGHGMDLHEIHDPIKDTDTIRLCPYIFGSGAVFKIVLGAALIAVGVFLLPAGGVSAGLISAGLGLVIGGVSTLLTKPPSTDLSKEATNNQSFIFSGPVNKTSQGAGIPIGYGRMIIGSITISAEVSTSDISVS